MQVQNVNTNLFYHVIYFHVISYMKNLEIFN